MVVTMFGNMCLILYLGKRESNQADRLSIFNYGSSKVRLSSSDRKEDLEAGEGFFVQGVNDKKLNFMFKFYN